MRTSGRPRSIRGSAWASACCSQCCKAFSWLPSSRPWQRRRAPYVARGGRRAGIADHMIRHIDAYLSACQLGITLASLALGWIGEPASGGLMGPVFPKLGISQNVSRSISLTLAFVTITVLHIVLGEQAPKSF